MHSKFRETENAWILKISNKCFGPRWSVSHPGRSSSSSWPWPWRSWFLRPTGLAYNNQLSAFGMGVEQTISGKEVAKHNTRQSCWIIVHGEAQQTACRYPFWPVVPFLGIVYDVTEFLDGITLQLLLSDACISPSVPIRIRPSWYWSFHPVQNYSANIMPQVVVKLYWNMPGKMQRNSCIILILNCYKNFQPDRNMNPFIHQTLSLQTFHQKNSKALHSFLWDVLTPLSFVA